MKKLIEAAKKLDWDLEIRKECEKLIELRVLNDEIKHFELSDITSYKIKAIVLNKTVKLICEDISDTENIINQIKINAEILDNEDKDFLAEESIVYDGELKRNNIDLDEIRDTLLSLSKYHDKYSNLVNIDSIIDLFICNISICNTNDIYLEDNISSNHLYMNVTVKSDNIVSDGEDYQLFNEISKEDLIKLFERLYDDANKRLNEESIKTSKYNVIINNDCMFDLLNTFKDAFLARNINKGVSLFNNSFLKKIFSPLINIVEDPLNNDLPGKRLFDGEGTRCIFKNIVKNGTFITKLYDIKESIKDGVKSTGNSDGVHNMYLVPGNVSFDELVKMMQNGIILTDLSGLHSGVNTITGDMSLDASGYLVEDGVITKPLNSILLSANILEVLNNVKCIGNDLKFGSTKIGSPSILCENIMIVGEK